MMNGEMSQRPAAPKREALLLVVDDREDNRLTIAEAFERQGYPVLTASGGHEAIEKIANHGPDLVICDLKMPDMDGIEVLKTVRTGGNPPEFILLTAYGTVETAVDALKHGAFNYLTKPVNLRDLRAQVEKALEHRQMRKEVKRLRRQVQVEASPVGGGAVIESPAMRQLMSMVERLAGTHSSVLVEGESGVGKEIVAQAIHRVSGLGEDKPFIAVHCAALPESLLESELFGYEKGAFTGAFEQRLGRLELANGGTLFLDEVGEIPLSMQVKLLRVLEQRELTRIGGRHVIKVDFRLITATNRNLEEEVRAGRFREDLYYRLNVVRLLVPPLRERREDVLPLFRLYLRRFAAEQGTPPPLLTPEVEARLEGYSWPGNVRELRNVAERLSIFAAGRELGMADLPFGGAAPAVPGGAAPQAAPRPLGAPMASPGAEAGADLLDLEELERRAIQRALEQFGGNRSAAADALGISRRTLQRKLKEYKMATDQDLDL